MAQAETTTPKTYSAMDPRDFSDHDNEEVRRGTVRKDTAKKILRNGWIESAECDGQYTDDYKRDAARNFGKGPRTAEAVLDACDPVDPRNCWVTEYEDGSLELELHWSFQDYTVELGTDAVTFEF
jgi:hypothetical protein